MTWRFTERRSTIVKSVVAYTVELTAFQGEQGSSTERRVHTDVSAF